MRKDEIVIGERYAAEVGWRTVGMVYVLAFEKHKKERYSGAARTETRVAVAVNDSRAISPQTDWTPRTLEPRDIAETWAEYEERKRREWDEQADRERRRATVEQELERRGWPLRENTKSGHYSLIEVSGRADGVVVTINDAEQFLGLLKL